MMKWKIICIRALLDGALIFINFDKINFIYILVSFHKPFSMISSDNPKGLLPGIYSKENFATFW